MSYKTKYFTLFSVSMNNRDLKLYIRVRYLKALQSMQSYNNIYLILFFAK